jgi:hypothetical protein
VGGLTAVVEAWFDSTGDSAGIVQTWVVRPRGHGAVARYYCLTGVLNAAYFSRVFVGRHGAQSMSGKQITVKKKSLLAMPVPMLVARDSDFGRRPDLDICQDDPFAPSSRTALECLLARVVALIQCLGPDGADTATLDKLAHFSAGVLYGRNEGDCEADYRWWCARCGVSPVPASWSEMINVVAGINELGGEHV